jgi:lipopolysaccharide transport system ATP-binding protein
MSRISARDITVEFPIYEASGRSFKSALVKAATGGLLSIDSHQHVMVRALNCLSFELRDGDRIGLVGHNGSGKSTLLRVLAGAYEPVSGAIEVEGRVASMLNVWLGMIIDATGHENIYLRCAIMGLKPREIAAVVDDIVEFSEIGDYIHMPLRTYSSGMQMRLAFAVATCVAADIVLMDEWLSAGDASFATKAQERLNRLLDRAGIFVVATHDESLIKRTCNKIMRLEHGDLVEFATL